MFMIGIDPHKGSHTATAVDASEAVVGEIRVEADRHQRARLLEWAAGFEPRTWAIEGATGLGSMLAQQLVGAGEHVVDVPPKLSSRVRLMDTGRIDKTDPNDARSAAIVALRNATLNTVTGEHEDRLGRVLTDGQVAAIEAVCSSGRGVDVVIGVAGAGKTTALDTARDALETAGCRVLGTSTSGQAARTLGTEAGIPSGTLRSLLWRLDHHDDVLDRDTVVVLDEATMTADADLLRLTVGIERAGAKLVLVGDQRQLSAIGPGGAIDALLERHPDIVTTLEENVRQTDPAERAALSHLRSGSVPDGVAWYARAGRTAIASTRTEALAAMVDQWATDIDAGHHTALLAWRRQDVTDLNRLARARYDTLGHLHGDDLTADGGRRYAVGDRVVTLAPNRAAQLVTSQQATSTAIDHNTQTLTARTDDGRRDHRHPRHPRRQPAPTRHRHRRPPRTTPTRASRARSPRAPPTPPLTSATPTGGSRPSEKS